MQKVKTTKIEKKYKDKKTGEYKSITIDHAKVKDRLKAFWEENPTGKIETSSSMMSENVVFKTFILTDKSNPASREATGHALGRLKTDNRGNLIEKEYEKLETLSVGRALALLGYATDGEVASLEEMEDYIKYKKEMAQREVEEWQSKLEGAKTAVELKSVWISIPAHIKKPLEEIKNNLKAKYEKKETK